nr:winged helix-turn-helix domain-containing protein [Oxobacter pfennigii]
MKLKLKEAQLLELLMNHKNMIVSKDSIIEKIWGYETEAADNHVEAHISLLSEYSGAVKPKFR